MQRGKPLSHPGAQQNPTSHPGGLYVGHPPHVWDSCAQESCVLGTHHMPRGPVLCAPIICPGVLCIGHPSRAQESYAWGTQQVPKSPAGHPPHAWESCTLATHHVPGVQLHMRTQPHMHSDSGFSVQAVGYPDTCPLLGQPEQHHVNATETHLNHNLFKLAKS